MTYLDFSSLHTQQCQGVDNAGATTSDYELWSPNDGRHGTGSNCFLGQQVTYVRRKQQSQCFNGEDLERVTHREPCACTEMDYECDWGYSRPIGSTGQCKLDFEPAVWEEKRKQRVSEQCEEYGVYEVTQGYRKVPGNICTSGLQLAPAVYKCTGFSVFSLRGAFLLCALAGLLFYGWPFVEAFLILLPLPDPKSLTRSVKMWYTSSKNWLTKEKKPQEPMHGYMQDFNAAPATLGDEHEDSEDVGQRKGFEGSNLMSYDSDDAGREDGELIQLDALPSNRRQKKVPKL